MPLDGPLNYQMHWTINIDAYSTLAGAQLSNSFMFFKVTLGRHSDKGSMLTGIPQEIRSREQISGHSDRVLARNFETVLAGIVILGQRHYMYKQMQEGVETHSKAPIREMQIQGLQVCTFL